MSILAFCIGLCRCFVLLLLFVLMRRMLSPSFVKRQVVGGILQHLQPEGETVCDSLSGGRGAWQVPVLPGACNPGMAIPDLQAGIMAQASTGVPCLDRAGNASSAALCM